MNGSERWSAVGIRVTILCSILNMFDGINIFTLTYLAPSLQKQFHAGAEGFSIVFSAGLAGMAFGGLVVATQADKFGRRPVIFLALGLMGLAMIWSAFAPSILMLAISRLFVGVGIGAVLASISALSASFAPDRLRNMAVGLPQAGYPLGAAAAGFLTAWALPIYGWSAIFLSAGILTLSLIPICLFLLPEAREAESPVRYTIAQAIGGSRLANSSLIWVCTISGFMALYFIASWVTKLAIQAGLPQTQAIIASAIYSGGAVVGTIVVSVAATRFPIGRLAAIMCVLAAGSFLVFGGVKMPVGPLLLTSFFIGIALQGGVNAIYPLTAGAYPPEARATGLGWAMGIGRLGAFLGPLVGGWAIGQGLPLVAVFGIFCVPLIIAATAALNVRTLAPA